MKPRCVICHRALTDALSCSLGIGPTCAKKTGVGRTKPRKLRKARVSQLSRLIEQALGIPLFEEGV